MEKQRVTENQLMEYRLYLQNDEKSRATVEKYLRDIRRFGMFLEGKAVSRELVLEYKRFLTRHYKAASVNSMLAALNGFLKWLRLEEYKVKPLKIQRQIFRSDEKELSKKDYNKLLNAAAKMQDERLKLIMQTICATGIRISELRFITVESLKDGYVQVNCKNKIRGIWMPKLLQRKLQRYASGMTLGKGPVFITSNGNAVGRSFIWKKMKTAAEIAGINKQKVYPHNLRHLFARTFYELNKDIVKLSNILGHSSVETTRIYTMTTSSEYAVCLEKLDLLGGIT